MESVETVVHVLPYGNSWRVKIAGHAPYEVFRQKQDAIDYGSQTARAQLPSKLIIHREDGTVDRTFTYRAPH